MRTLKKEIVTRLAYMIGVRDEALQKRYSQDCEEIIDEMYNSKEARIIRILNTIRSMMMQKYSYIDSAIKYELKNLDKIEYFNADDIKWLENNGIRIIQVNTTIDKYLIKINQLINENILQCKSLIPEWVPWEYIKDLFIIPGCNSSNEDAVLKILK